MIKNKKERKTMIECIYYVNESALDITKYTLKNFCDAFNDEEYAEISDSNYIYLTEKEAKEKLEQLKERIT
jgi:hypothetical protein